jgi:hypothetical protein
MFCLENEEKFEAWVEEMGNIAIEAERLANRVKNAIRLAAELRKGAAPHES